MSLKSSPPPLQEKQLKRVSKYYEKLEYKRVMANHNYTLFFLNNCRMKFIFYINVDKLLFYGIL